jgi:hypothetical protein
MLHLGERVSRLGMSPRFPPPDPYEQGPTILGHGMELSAPTAVFAVGQATPAADRIADQVLDIRPGLLIVLTGS